MYQLQKYARKSAIAPPVYGIVQEGTSHEPRFKAKVILNNAAYESPPGFPNVKSAKHAAANVALDACGLLQSSGGMGVAPSPVVKLSDYIDRRELLIRSMKRFTRNLLEGCDPSKSIII